MEPSATCKCMESRSQVQVASARSQVQLTSLLRAAGVVPTTLYENRPSAGIGVVEVQKLTGFCEFVLARATRGSAWSRCKNSGVLANLFWLARRGDRRGRGAKSRGFCDFCFGSRDPLRGSAWSRAKSRGVCDFCCSNRSSGVVSWFARPLPGPAGRGFDSPLVRGFASCTEQLA